MRRLSWMCAAVLLLAGSSLAQFTTVSGTVTDPNGLPYSNGTITATLVISATPVFTATALPYTPPSAPVGLNSAGSFVMQLADDTQLTPGGGRYSFQVCSAAGTVQPAGGSGPVCFSITNVNVTGASLSITTTLNAAALALTKPVSTSALGASVSVPTAGVTFVPLTGNQLTFTGPTDGGFVITQPGSPAATLSFQSGLAQLTGGSGMTLSSGGNGINADLFAQYHGNTVVLGATNGFAFEFATVGSNTLTANFNSGAAQTIVNHVTVAGTMFRIQGIEEINRAATTSSTMPSLTVSWTDAGGIARTLQVVATNSTNVTTVSSPFSTVVTTSGATDVTVTSAGYASVGGTSMQYELRLVVERLL